MELSDHFDLADSPSSLEVMTSGNGKGEGTRVIAFATPELEASLNRALLALERYDNGEDEDNE